MRYWPARAAVVSRPPVKSGDEFVTLNLMIERIGLHSPLTPEQVMKKREEEDKKVEGEQKQHRVSVLAFDEFERSIQQANVYASQGKTVEASAELDRAHEYAFEVRDQKLRDELMIRLNQARAAARA